LIGKPHRCADAKDFESKTLVWAAASAVFCKPSQKGFPATDCTEEASSLHCFYSTI